MTPRDQQVAFYENLGLAIAQWAHVEHSLLNIYCRVIGATHSAPAAAAFFAVQNFSAKLDMTNAAALFAITDPEYARQWQALYQRCKRKPKKRNQLAHFNVLFTKNKDSYRPVLRPQLFDPMNSVRYSGSSMPVLTYRELQSQANSFGKLSQDLFDFSETIPWSEQLPNTPA